MRGGGIHRSCRQTDGQAELRAREAAAMLAGGRRIRS